MMLDRYDYEVPPVKGGQGKSDEDMAEQANFLTDFIILIMILCVVVSIIWWAIK